MSSRSNRTSGALRCLNAALYGGYWLVVVAVAMSLVGSVLAGLFGFGFFAMNLRGGGGVLSVPLFLLSLAVAVLYASTSGIRGVSWLPRDRGVCGLLVGGGAYIVFAVTPLPVSI